MSILGTTAINHNSGNKHAASKKDNDKFYNINPNNKNQHYKLNLQQSPIHSQDISSDEILNSLLPIEHNIFKEARLKRSIQSQGEQQVEKSPQEIDATNWNTKNNKQKTDASFIAMLMRKNNLTQQQAEEKIRLITGFLYSTKRATKVNIQTELESLFPAVGPMTTRLIARYQELTKFLLENTETSYDNATEKAIEFIEQEPSLTVNTEKIYINRINKHLDSWIDWPQANNKLTTATKILLAVSEFEKIGLPTNFMVNFDLNQLLNKYVIDEATVLYERINPSAEEKTITEKQRDFINLLRQEKQEQEKVDNLFSLNLIDNENSEIYFDGLTFKNATGKNFDDLINAEELNKIEGYSALTTEAKRALLQKKFAQIGESTQYNIGTVQHSIASILIRILHYQNKEVPETFASEQEMMTKFQEIENEWQEKKNYPIRPSLLFAQHLAYSSGVEIRGEHWREELWALGNVINSLRNK